MTYQEKEELRKWLEQLPDENLLPGYVSLAASGSFIVMFTCAPAWPLAVIFAAYLGWAVSSFLKKTQQASYISRRDKQNVRAAAIGSFIGLGLGLLYVAHVNIMPAVEKNKLTQTTSSKPLTTITRTYVQHQGRAGR